MAEIGFYEGYLEGMQGLQRMQSQALDYKIKSEEFRKQQDERALLSKVFNAQSNQKIGMQQDQSEMQLAQQYKRAGQALMAINPKDGMAFMKQAEDMSMKASQKQVHSFQVLKAQNELAGEISAGVIDQSSLTNAVNQLAQLGIRVPPQFRQWGPQAEAYFKFKAMQSIPMAKQLELGARQQQIEINQKRLDETKAENDRKDAARQVREKRLQNQLKVKTARLEKPVKEEDVLSEVKILQSMKAGVKNLDPGEKRMVAQLVRQRAAQNLKDNVGDEDYDEEKAFFEARQSVLDQIETEDGILGTPFMSKAKLKAKQQQQGGKPSQQQFEEGKIYVDAKGNKAKYVNGNWVEVK